ncbi:D-2-hydroxyacid dehydrogenase [Brevibacterium zhoupengii]|uniref:D-2-hydroxyacid dehydrogenase n=1 Tax=Brevibacterium zhoupengii TaxID=2898795 RepID=UPI001F091AEE|nr:D-2-hydroxyacid dehydrogenase [Brevibacterium zhoupengii]
MMLRVAVIDRSDGADSFLLGDLGSAVNVSEAEFAVQRLLPTELRQVHPDTSVVFVRAGYWNDVESLLEIASSLTWLHVNMTGIDHLPVDRLEAAGVILTNCSGVLDHAIAEFVLGGMLLWSKGLLRSALDTRERQTEYREPKANSELNALIIGTGNIGSECARVLRQAGVGRIVGIRRTPVPLPDFDAVLSGGALSDQIGQHDVIVSCLPASKATDGLIGSDVLRRLREESVFINVGRGSTVDHLALAEEMNARAKAVTVLDVTDPEPLPSDHPLWRCSNVVISPHMSGDTIGRHDAFATLFLENLRRYCAGEDLLNRVGQQPKTA